MAAVSPSIVTLDAFIEMPPTASPAVAYDSIVGSSSAGDIHVVDVSSLANPVEVASLHLPGAGVHNFWMDEPRQILYAAYYNGGVVALDVSGTLTGSLADRVMAQTRPAGTATYVWGVMLHQGSLYGSDMQSGLWQLTPP